MLTFDESFAGGFFGFGRTYGCVARIELDAIDTLAADWRAALDDIVMWRERRASRARSVHFHFIVVPSIVTGIKGHIGASLLSGDGEYPPQLGGLRVEVAVFDPDGGQYIDLIIYPEQDVNGPHRRDG